MRVSLMVDFPNSTFLSYMILARQSMWVIYEFIAYQVPPNFVAKNAAT